MLSARHLFEHPDVSLLSLPSFHGNLIALRLWKPPEAAQFVAAECVVEAETKDHMNWELIGRVAEKLTGDEKKILKEAR